jgi:hypothetical protein
MKMAPESEIVKIDRRALVSRHDVTWSGPTEAMPLGNGEFAFNADGTGLQTFSGNTMAHWAWHSFPLPPGVSPSDVPHTGTFQVGRPHGEDPAPPEPLGQWMRKNPHGFNLGRLRFQWHGGREIRKGEIERAECKVKLWCGRLSAQFDLGGEPVRVTTCVHPEMDAVAVRVESRLLAKNKIEIALDFPYPNRQTVAWSGDFEAKPAHRTRFVRGPGNEVAVRREVDETRYFARLAWSGAGEFLGQEAGHIAVLRFAGEDTVELTLRYSSEPIPEGLPSFASCAAATSAWWEAFWLSGGAIDLSESRDPRWRELERRVVLSQYHAAAQSHGSNPPAEAALMEVDAWGSRFHMEMIWWHLTHFYLWGRREMVGGAYEVYRRFLPMAKETARQLGLKGAIWPKGVGPDGVNQPWYGNLALLWKQPHPLFFAELEYRGEPTRETLEKWADILYETAEYMAAYAQWDDVAGQYFLSPNVTPGETGITTNGIFDLAYWRWGLAQAQLWRERMGLPRMEEWGHVQRHLPPLPVQGGLLVHSDEWRDTYATRNYEHPDPIGALGMLPSTEVDPEVARATVHKVFECWRWDTTWGWDFPWMAMAAARVGETQRAVDSLLMDVPRNGYDWRGVNQGGPNLSAYSPGNCGTLYAVAMMAAGWDGAPARPNPGFPDDGSWRVRCEGLMRAL